MEPEKLNIYDIVHGMFLSLDNCQSLIEDAELLLQHERVPRSYVLAQLANEEIGKSFILYNLYMALKIDEIEIDYKKIRKSFYDHQSKTFEATMADFMLAGQKKLSEEERDLEITAILKEIKRGKEDYNQLKNQGLYVSLEDGKFANPKDLISHDEAESAIKKAKERKEITFKIAKREVDFDLDHGTHPRFFTDLKA